MSPPVQFPPFPADDSQPPQPVSPKLPVAPTPAPDVEPALPPALAALDQRYRRILVAMDAETARLQQQVQDLNDGGDDFIQNDPQPFEPPFVAGPPDPEPTYHEWRTITQAHPTDATQRQWSIVDGADDSDTAGTIINPKGDAIYNVASPDWTDYTIADGVHAWLIVALNVDAGTMANSGTEITTTDPTYDMDVTPPPPFDPTTVKLAFDLFDIAADGTVKDFQFTQINTQGIFNGITVGSPGITVSGVPTKSHTGPIPVLTFPNWTLYFKYGRLTLCTVNADVVITIC